MNYVFLTAVDFNKLLGDNIQDYTEVTYESAKEECQWRSSGDAIKMGSLTKSF